MFFNRLPEAGYVCAHRGARSLAPENTMLAAELAFKNGADFWEMDVQKTADGTLVVFHDDLLERTTDIALHPEFVSRKPWAVAEFTLAELGTLDAGSWFEQDVYGTIASGEVSKETLAMMRGVKIPTLKEALEFTRRHDFPINIEIKDVSKTAGDSTIVADVLDMVKATDTDDLVLISSFNHRYLERLHQTAPEIPLAVLVEDSHPENIVEYVRSLGAAGYHPDADMTEPEMVRFLADKGLYVSPFTVNDMEDAISFIEAGCFGITTDYTQRLRKKLLAL